MTYNDFDTFLKNEIEKLKDKQGILSSEGKSDELKHTKIEQNVYEIFKTVLKVAYNQNKTDEEARSFFLDKLASIPKNWHIAYHYAKDHNDYEQEYQEKLKIDVASKILTAYPYERITK